jgi:hypothetical protein
LVHTQLTIYGNSSLKNKKEKKRKKHCPQYRDGFKKKTPHQLSQFLQSDLERMSQRESSGTLFQNSSFEHGRKTSG